MRVKLVEVTNGSRNWGKFLLGQFDSEWAYKSAIDGNSIVAGRGWSRDHILVLDLQTGEGATFRPGGSAKHDLDKRRVWVCPMFEPFLTWLYKQPNPMEISAHVDLPDAEFAMAGYRRPGPGVTVDAVRAWGGLPPPEQFRGEGPFEISGAMLDELSEIFDVAIIHHTQPQPSKKERGRGAKPVPSKRILWLDVVGGKFTQR